MRFVNPIPVVNAGTDKIIQIGATALMDAVVTQPSQYDYLWTPSAGLSTTTILQPMAAPIATTTYLLTVTDNNTHCSGKYDVVVGVISQLHVPNSFTPNGDNLNDRWNIPGMALYADGLVTIYNRYGQVIFQSKNYVSNPWDGTFKGVKQPAGTYIYLLELNDSKKQFIQGTISIIR